MDTLFLADPVRALSVMLINRARQAGFEEVEPGRGVLDGDDGVFSLPLELAFGRTGLLPLVTEHARLVYAAAWMDRSGEAFPFMPVPDPEGLLGLAVEWKADQGAFSAALLCALDVLEAVIAASDRRGSAPILILE